MALIDAPVFSALAVSDCYLVSAEIDVLDAQAQTFHKPQSRSVHEGCHKLFVVGKSVEDCPDLISRHNDGQSFRFPRTYNANERPDFAAYDETVEEKQGGESLVLRRSADIVLHGKVGEKCVYFMFGHLRRMPEVVEVDEPLDPLAVGFFSPVAVVSGPPLHFLNRLVYRRIYDEFGHG